MELKTDKIHRILNTPHDELAPEDFDAAQEQINTLVSCVGGTQRNYLEKFDRIAAERDRLCERIRVLQGICERLKRELEEARVALVAGDHARAELEHALNAGEIITALTKERDDAQSRELKALRQLADEVGRVEKLKDDNRVAEQRRHNARLIDDRAVARLQEEIAELKQHLTDAQLDRAGAPAISYEADAKLGPAGKPASAESGGGLSGVGTDGHPCQMPTPDGKCVSWGVARVNGFDYCERHLNAIRGTARMPLCGALTPYGRCNETAMVEECGYTYCQRHAPSLGHVTPPVPGTDL